MYDLVVPLTKIQGKECEKLERGLNKILKKII